MSSRNRRLELDEESCRTSLHSDYHVLLQLYSLCHLTIGSNIIPAFYLGGRYPAGLWSTDIVKGLLWKRADIWCRHSSPYRAPSYSWTVTDDPISFPDDSLMPSTPQYLELVSPSHCPLQFIEPLRRGHGRDSDRQRTDCATRVPQTACP